MDPVAISGDAFSEYFLRELMWEDRKLRASLDEPGARERYRDVVSLMRRARRQLQERHTARSTRSMLLHPLADLLGWRLGEETRVATEEGDERAGVPLLGGEAPVANILALAPDVAMDSAPEGHHRRFAPLLSLVRVLEEQGTDHGLLLNAYRLRLVRRAEGFVASWADFDLSAIAEGADAGFEAWRTIWALLRQDAWEQDPSTLEHVVSLGRDHATRVNVGLGQQVQAAVVAFIQGVLDHPENEGKVGRPPSHSELDQLYRESLRVLYRILFALYAEDRGLLPIDVPTYRDGYSLRRLSRWIRDADTDPRRNPTLGGRFVEASLRALFGLLRMGADLGPEGKIPTYGGGLFDPREAPLVDSLRWGEATCAEVIERMTWVPAGPRRRPVHLSYTELDVEQLGSVYETLLEQSVDYAVEPMWRIRLDDRPYVVTEEQRQDLAARRGEVLSSEVEALLASDDEEEEEDESANDEPEEEGEEERPTRSRKPVRVLARVEPGKVFLRTGMGRKQTGSYYTNRAFVDFLVRRTVDPLAEGKKAHEILALKIVDPATGSGHFLVGACRRLADHLLAAYRGMDPDEVPQEVTRVWQDEERALAACRLLAAAHCMYGVDKNPLAVDLARVSLWLATAATDHPLTFLDHRLRVGDSLLGMKADDALRPWAPLPTKKGRKPSKKARSVLPLVGRPLVLEELYEGAGRQLRERLRRAFEHLKTIRQLADERPEDLEAHRLAYQAMLGELAPFWDLHQLRIGLAFVDGADPEVINSWLKDIGTLGFVQSETREQTVNAWQRGRDLQAFCWDLAFPDVWFDEEGKPKGNGGFDVVIGNPPWEQVKIYRKEFYEQYDPAIRDLQGSHLAARVRVLNRESFVARAWEGYERHAERYKRAILEGNLYRLQVAVVAGEKTRGHPDFYRLFLERSLQVLREGGHSGLLLPSGVYCQEGATGIRRHLLQDCSVGELYSFENRRKLFPIDSRAKFAALTWTKGGQTDLVVAAFMLHDADWLVLKPGQRDGRVLHLSRKMIARFSPLYLSIPEFRSAREAELAESIYDRHPPLSQTSADGWSVEISRELNMTEDSELFRLASSLIEEDGYRRTGDGYLRGPHGDVYVPLYEGRLVQQFDHIAKAYVSGEGRGARWRELSFNEKDLVPHYFFPLADFRQRFPSKCRYRAGLCAVTGQTNERTLLTAMIPRDCPCPHPVPTLTTSPDSSEVHLLWVGIANSFVADWLLRLQVSTGVGYYLLEQTAFPRPSVDAEQSRAVIVRVLGLACFSSHMADLWNEVAQHYPDDLVVPWRPELAASRLSERARLRSEIDAIVADLYGLSVEEFAYILTTFPLLDRSQPALPGDLFIRQTNRGERIEPRSCITRDTALLEYCRHKGVAPPDDIVAFYADIGVDISRRTGPIRNLEERVAEATRLGAIAYVPTPTRRRRP